MIRTVQRSYNAVPCCIHPMNFAIYQEYMCGLNDRRCFYRTDWHTCLELDRPYRTILFNGSRVAEQPYLLLPAVISLFLYYFFPLAHRSRRSRNFRKRLEVAVILECLLQIFGGPKTYIFAIFATLLPETAVRYRRGKEYRKYKTILSGYVITVFFLDGLHGYLAAHWFSSLSAVD